MRKTRGLVKNGFKAVTDLNLLKILQSEIQHELSSSPPPRHHSPASGLGDFVVEWDSAETNDVLLRRKLDGGEEVAVSARLSPFDRCICCPSQMKICVKKPGLNALLHFHCQFMVNHDAPTSSSSWFRILRCHYLHSPSSISPRLYTPKLDSELRSALQEYLVAKGIGQEFTSFLWHYLCKKEQGQYVNWLHKLESFVV